MTIAEGFFATEIRVGTVVEAAPFPEARKPAIRLKIDFGPEIGLRWSSAQITTHYSPETLVGRQVVAAMNLGTKRIAGFTSEVLVLGAMETPTQVILLVPERPAPNGARIA
ncbi:MAG TPA: tRNA-binding protein [Gemmatimonadaceae bacterium]|nr:tRNA-binding protein [Gemmatimonadaceae bacterium]